MPDRPSRPWPARGKKDVNPLVFVFFAKKRERGGWGGPGEREIETGRERGGRERERGGGRGREVGREGSER